MYKIYKQYYVPTKDDPWWAKGNIYVERFENEPIVIKAELDTIQKAIEELDKIQVDGRRYVILDINNKIIQTKEPIIEG